MLTGTLYSRLWVLAAEHWKSHEKFPDFRAGNRGIRLTAVLPQAGLALLHRHWQSALEWEGAAVKGGTKNVLRADVVFEEQY